MLLLFDVHAVPPAPAPDGSLEGWLWLILALVVVVSGGAFLASRR